MHRINKQKVSRIRSENLETLIRFTVNLLVDLGGSVEYYEDKTWKGVLWVPPTGLTPIHMLVPGDWGNSERKCAETIQLINAQVADCRAVGSFWDRLDQIEA